MALLLTLLACSGPDTGDTPTDDSADDTATDTCTGPTPEEFGSQYAELYCPWLRACPNPPDLNWKKCEAFYTAMWTGLDTNYQPCRAQECLNTLGAGLPACSDNGGEWLEIAACQPGYVTPSSR